jgi:kynurenine 3-monooxygenase
MRGRGIHDRAGGYGVLPYGQRSHEVIHSVSRAGLNLALVEAAARVPGVEFRFGHACTGLGATPGRARILDVASGAAFDSSGEVTIGADGAGSALRRALEAVGMTRSREDPLDHAYKELTLPAGPGGMHRLDRDVLHVWPRGEFMLIALPNTDGSFTATLFLPRRGPGGFESLREPTAVRGFFEREFPGVLPLIPDLERQFLANPEGLLGTLHCERWHAGGTLLLGDAAHAIVPFHGQGMNCAFEDCAELATLLDEGLDWPAAFAEFELRRRPNAEAIARMALENYLEMRDTVLDPVFLRRKALGLRLERRHPQRFIPRYSMVTFHPEIPYAEALRRGAVQQDILARIDAAAGGLEPERVELGPFDDMVRERLTELAH